MGANMESGQAEGILLVFAQATEILKCNNHCSVEVERCMRGVDGDGVPRDSIAAAL